MKKLISLERAISFVILMLVSFSIVSCGKVTVGPQKDPPPPPTPTVKPTVNATVPTTGALWFNEGTTLNYSSTHADSGVWVNGQKLATTSGTFVVRNLKKDTTFTFSAKNKAGAISCSVPITVYSEKISLFCNKSPQKQTLYQVCSTDSLNFSSAIHNIPLDCNSYIYKPDGTGVMTIGACGPVPNTNWNISWKFVDNENRIQYGEGISNLWDLDFVTNTSYQRSQIKEDPLNPGKFFKTTQRFEVQ